MNSTRLVIPAFENEWRDIVLTPELVLSYSLEKWAEQFSLMTAGYRDQLNPDDAHDPGVAFNSLTVSILGEAKARVFERKLNVGESAHVHVGGETRPHTQEFIAILARVYAAHRFIVHLRTPVHTTPIWYSSFGVFFKEYQSGDNLTASHSPYFKGGWKPMDAAGKQLFEDEEDIITEVRKIVAERACIRLAPWDFPGMILADFDVDDAYVNYQKSVFVGKSLSEIRRAAEAGFRCAICTVGGSMKATTERLFPRLGIPPSGNGFIHYLYGEEDSRYHQLGVTEGIHSGPDPSKKEIYKNIGAQDSLLRNRADIVFIWDPDGDRLNIVTTALASEADRARALGLDVEAVSNSDKVIVYFKPNQLFFMLTAYRIGILKETGLLEAYDWFVTPSISTSRAISELAAKECIPVVQVRVGFKYVGTLSEWLENREDPEMPYVNAVGDRIRIGGKPRALMMCEESGGAVFGGTELLMNQSRSKGLLALREKDGMQIGLMTICLAAEIFNSHRTFADYYCDHIEKNDIKYRFFIRKDIILYDESLTGKARREAQIEGERRSRRTMEFFNLLAKKASTGTSLSEIQRTMNSRLAPGDKELPVPIRISNVGQGKQIEGTWIDFIDFWFLIRASGTDALLRYYIEGKDERAIVAFQQALINLKI